MTATVKSKAPLTVPELVRRRAGFKPGDRIEFKASRGVVVLTRCLEESDRDHTLSAAEAKKVRHAMKQLREGKTTSWQQVKDELGL